MTAHRLETVVETDGTLTIRDLPFEAGAAVEVIVRERIIVPPAADPYSLRGTVERYEHPLEPAAAEEEWDALQ